MNVWMYECNWKIMFLKTKSIILKAFPTYGSKISSITFELHFDYIFCIFLHLENSKHKPKNTKVQQGQVKKRQKLRQEFGKSGKNKILLWYWRKLASNPNKSNTLAINFQLHLLWNCQLLYNQLHSILQLSCSLIKSIKQFHYFSTLTIFTTN